MKTFRLPNFSGCKALVVHPCDSNIKILVEQLQKLGLDVETRWPVDDLQPVNIDVIFFDADLGYSQQFAWVPGASPIPLIALLGSESPGRIEWTLTQLPSAYILKPVRFTGVFSALSIAFHNFERHQRLQQKVDELGERLRAKPLVLAAIQMLTKELSLDNNEAYRLLRDSSMRNRISVEALCEQIVALQSLAPLHQEIGSSSAEGRQ